MRVSFLIPATFSKERRYKEVIDSLETLPPTGSLYFGTMFSWTYQTWKLLHDAGVACELVTEPPDEGILLVHLDHAMRHQDYFQQPELLSKKLFIVNILADGKFHPAAHLHLVQNKRQSYFFPYSLFMPHWPHPHLIPRDPARGTRFENISFFGDPRCIAPELISEEWNNQLRRTTGLYFSLKPPSHWHDYSDTDAVLAIRSFSRSSHFQKPATKLYNAWLAGVPFIGGNDSAYAADGLVRKNYFAATSPRNLLAILKELKENQKLRSTLVEQGTRAGLFFSREAILARWKKMVQEILPSYALAWQQKSAFQRRCEILYRHAFCTIDHYFVKPPHYSSIVLD